MKKYLLLILISFGLISCVKEKTQSAHQLLLISFDGFRADYLSKTETPNFDELVKTGVTSEGLIPIFPTKTFPNHYAIATGLYPENNGLVGNQMYDPNFDASYSLGDREAVEDPRWYEGEPIWNTAEKQGKKAGTMFWVGSEAPIQDMRPTHWKKYNGRMPNTDRIDTVMAWLTLPDSQKVDFASLYFSFVDSKGHRFGPDSPEVIEAIQYADSLMGYLIQTMKKKELWGKLDVMIVSDHGMSSISRDKIVLMDDYFDVNDVEVISSSPVVMLNTKPGKLESVYSSLKANENHFKVYKKDELPERYHLKNHRRIPELILVADLGYTINTKDFFENHPAYPEGGTHGFDNNEKEMRALFISSGPDFKNGIKTPAFENIHLYEVMSHVLGLTPAPNDGSLDSVKIMLQ